MKKMKRSTLNGIVYVITIVFSILFVVDGNRVSNTSLRTEGVHELQMESGIVQKIIDVELEEFSLGEGEDSIVTEKNIIFSAYIKSLDKEVIARQVIDSMYPINPKDVEEGDKVLLSFLSEMEADAPDEWVFAEYQRSDTLIWFGAAFLVLVILFGRKKGVNTIVSLIFTCLAVFAVFVPSILAGHNIYISSIITCLFIIFMTLLIINGVGKKTFCAAIGCLGGLAVTGILTVMMDRILNLTGATDEDAVFLFLMNESNPIDLRAVIFGAIIIGALGATMDISMSISSSIKEISDNAADNSFKTLVKSGLNIGRDIMGTMANTLILAYIGSSLSIVLLLVANSHSLLNLFNREMIVVEIMQALVGSFGILFTIPITSILSAYVYSFNSKKLKQEKSLIDHSVEEFNEPSNDEDAEDDVQASIED